jgi:hypothetical protein
LTARLSLGGDYDAQRAILAGGTRTFDVQSALGTVEFVMSQGLSATVGYGHAWLFTSDGMRRNGPAFDVGLEWRRPRTIGSVHYRRAFLPSFGFGGTFQNQELGATLQATLSRGLRWSGGAAYSNNDPLVPGDPTLRTVSTRTSLGWVVKRRLQFDLFALHIAQNSQLAGGRVNRTRAGVQATVTEVMRAPR